MRRRFSPAAALAEAQGYFVQWMERSDRFLQYGLDGVERDWPKEAAFNFHQATERLYACFLLVQTLYSPKSHRIDFLRSQAEQLAPALARAWPRETRFEQRSFELLRRAYIDAQYSPYYKISSDELEWLAERIAALREIVREACMARLTELGATA
jgi:HEPN domain-containing protein